MKASDDYLRASVVIQQKTGDLVMHCSDLNPIVYCIQGNAFCFSLVFTHSNTQLDDVTRYSSQLAV